MKLDLALGSALAQQVVAVAVKQPSVTTRATNVSLAPSLERWPDGLHLAVDYYPSQWPEYMWEDDLSRMREANISYVRVNEFDWSVLEPSEGQYNFTLLDTTLELFQRYGLKAIIGTPTPSPPNWVMEKYDVSFVDRTNTTLLFGSRRHYSFSSFDYRTLSQKITTKLAERYGDHPAVVGWQLDNELGCHDTVRSYDQNAVKRFRTWLKNKYGTVEKMNEQQGRVFWSSQYESFEAVQPPFLEIYTNNELHSLDWYTFSSDMVIEFAKEQVEILRQHAPSHFITHNFMVEYTDFDHFKFARETGIDLATFDQYALAGPTTLAGVSDDDKTAFLRTGLPDYQALHQALYRGVAGAAYNKTSGPWGVMEMEPGVLNWSPNRVSPAEGMVRLWTHEVFANSGDMVNYFRWRQIDYAQEQTLSGLFLWDNTEDEGFTESQVVAHEDLPKLRQAASLDREGQASVALVFDYAAQWTWDIEPYSGSWDVKSASYTDVAVKYMTLVYNFYSALRRLGLSVDVIGPDQSIEGYKLVVVPSIPIIPDAFNAQLENFSGQIVFGPHSGSKTAAFRNAAGLNPGNTALGQKLPLRVTRVETPPDYAGSGVSYDGEKYNVSGWEEWVSCQRQNQTSKVAIKYTSPHRPGKPAACSKDGNHYLGFNPTVPLLVSYLGDVASEAGLKDVMGRPVSKDNDLGASLRVSKRDSLLWALNYGLESVTPPSIEDADLLVGEKGDIPGAGVAIWKL